MKKYLCFEMLVVLLGGICMLLYATANDGAAFGLGLFIFALICIRKITISLKEAGELVDRADKELS